MAFNLSDFEGYFERLDTGSKSLSKSELNTILGLRNAQKCMQYALAVHIEEFEIAEREKIYNNQKVRSCFTQTDSQVSSLECRVSDIQESQKGMQSALAVRIKEFEIVERGEIYNNQKQKVRSSYTQTDSRVIQDSANNLAGGWGGITPAESANQLNETKCAGSPADKDREIQGDAEKKSEIQSEGENKQSDAVKIEGSSRHQSHSNPGVNSDVNELECGILGSVSQESDPKMAKGPPRHGCLPSLTCCMPLLYELKKCLGVASPK
jgi:hypothetical protein